MTINTLSANPPVAVHPHQFVAGKIYRCLTATGDYLVMGTRAHKLNDNSELCGVALDNSATPWFTHDRGRCFIEVDITIAVTG